MHNEFITRRVFPIARVLTLVLLVGVALSQMESPAVSESGLFQSPLRTPPSPFDSPLPTPVPPQTKPSEAAQKALEYIAKRENIPAEALTIAADHPTEYPALGREFQVVTLLDDRPEGQIYKLLVDLADGRIEEDISALLAAEAQAHQAHYGKLEPALYERLQTLKDDDTVPVAVWMAAQPGQTLAEQQEAAFAALEAKYPEAKSALEHSKMPWDVDDPELAERIEAEYVAFLNAEIRVRTQPLAAELERRGFTVTTYEGLPSFATELPKQAILELSEREDVGAIYLIEARLQPEMNSAAPTMLAPVVWSRGYDGSDVTIAILEPGNVDSSNTYLHLSSTSRPGMNDPDLKNHATCMASAAASYHGTYKGIAHGATILRASLKSCHAAVATYRSLGYTSWMKKPGGADAYGRATQKEVVSQRSDRRRVAENRTLRARIQARR